MTLPEVGSVGTDLDSWSQELKAPEHWERSDGVGIIYCVDVPDRDCPRCILESKLLEKVGEIMQVDCPIIQELLKYEIPVHLTKEGFKVEGFYKSGTVTLESVKDSDVKYIAISRYGEREEIRTFADLAFLNAHWFFRTRERHHPDCLSCRPLPAAPDHHWEQALLDYKILERKETVVVDYSYTITKCLAVKVGGR